MAAIEDAGDFEVFFDPEVFGELGDLRRGSPRGDGRDQRHFHERPCDRGPARRLAGRLDLGPAFHLPGLPPCPPARARATP